MRAALPLLVGVLLAACGAGGESQDGELPSPGEDPTSVSDPPRSRVLITELMYHPVREEAFVEEHEFLELHNAGDAAAELEGWALDRGVHFIFPAHRLGPGETIIVAADLDAFASLHGAPVEVFGPWEGQLANGGERVRLVDGNEEPVDELRYDDEAPWPIGADGLGASSRWLPASDLPLDDHRGHGRSLQRVSLKGPSDDPGNWKASPLDGTDPGSVASASADGPEPVALAVTWNGAAPGPLTPGAPLMMELDLGGVADAVGVEWFVDDLQTAGEPVSVENLRDDGVSPDTTAGDGRWTVNLPAQAAGTVVRWRLLAEVEEVPTALVPRVGDPFEWNGVFVGNELPGTRAYQLFVDPDAWTSLWDVIGPGRVLDDDCSPNPGWRDRVPAVFVHGSSVRDVFVRYQGSRWQRKNGQDIPSWSAPGPDAPDPLKALSWSVLFPRFAPLDGMDSVSLNKLSQSCPGLNAMVGFQLFGEVGLPVPRTRFVRLFINGAYFNYTLEIERPGDGSLDRWLDTTVAGEEEPDVPHLFKSSGCACDEGPWGWGDERPLEDYCGFSAQERYAWTYERKTWDWVGHEELMAMVEGLDAARAVGGETLQTFLEANFDVGRVLDYMAVMNWSVPFDDMFHNHYLVQKLSDGRWFLAPWDLDNNFGIWKGANASIYIGEEGDPDNRGGRWNTIKDAFLEVFRAEFDMRLAALNETVLSPEEVIARVDAVEDQWNLVEVTAAPGGPACNFTGEAASFRAFAQQRQGVVRAATGP